jgi:hypothetical protein
VVVGCSCATVSKKSSSACTEAPNVGVLHGFLHALRLPSFYLDGSQDPFGHCEPLPGACDLGDCLECSLAWCAGTINLPRSSIFLIELGHNKATNLDPSGPCGEYSVTVGYLLLLNY